MANDEIKTNAEIYREQRKDRLAKAEKKKNRSPKADKIIRIIVKTVAIILVAALVLFVIGRMLLNVFAVPQKILSTAKYDGDRVTVAEYNYYYMSLYNQIYQTAYQYESNYSSSYGTGVGKSMTGFDYTADPVNQKYPYSDVKDASVKTWSDYFRVMASKRAFLIGTLYNKAMSDDAKKAGFVLSSSDKDSIKSDIDKTIDQLRTYANNNNYSLTNYISLKCGEGLTEKSYRALLEKDAIVQKYLSWYQKNTAKNYTAKEVKDYYTKNKDTYNEVSLRLFAVAYGTSASSGSSDKKYTQQQAKARADEFLSKVTGEKSFIALTKEYCQPSEASTYKEDKATLLENYAKSKFSSNADLSNWLFASSRKAGDKTVIFDKTNSCYYIVYLTKAASPDMTMTVDARHILIKYESTTTDSSGSSKSLDAATVAKNKAAAKAKAQSILKEWKAGKATEDTFATLANKYSDDTGSNGSSSSATNGGLYEAIEPNQMVTSFNDWIFDPARKTGDTAIVESTYGYHVIYFVAKATEPKWMTSVRSDMASKAYSDYTDKTYSDIEKNIKENTKIIKYFAARQQEKLTISLASASSSSTATTTAS